MMNDYHSAPNGLPFVTTTLKLIGQYEQASRGYLDKDKLETTLLINCLLGLLIVPQEYVEKQESIRIGVESDEQDWGIRLADVKYCGSHKSCKIKDRGTANEVARHLRNSLVHKNRFEIQSDDGVNITHILFKDFASPAEQSFEYRFEISNLKKFIKKFYDSVFP